MSDFLSASIPVTVFKVDEPGKITADTLKKYAFQSIDDRKSEARAVGWVNIDDMMDSSWQVSPPEKGHFMCFSFRVDTRKVPPAVLKKHLDLALKEELDRGRGEGREFVSRPRKREIKEQVTLKLIVQIQPVPMTVACALDTMSGLFYVGSSSGSVLERIQELCGTSFGVTLQELSLGGLEDEEDLPEDVMEHFLRAVYDAPLEGTFDGSHYTLSDLGDMTLNGADGSSVSVKKTSEGVDPCLEAGMNIQKLKLALDSGGGEHWEMSLAKDFRFSALKCPATDKGGETDDDANADADAVLLERLYLITQAIGAVHTLFRDFVRQA